MDKKKDPLAWLLSKGWVIASHEISSLTQFFHDPLDLKAKSLAGALASQHKRDKAQLTIGKCQSCKERNVLISPYHLKPRSCMPCKLSCISGKNKIAEKTTTITFTCNVAISDQINEIQKTENHKKRAETLRLIVDLGLQAYREKLNGLRL